MIHTYRLCHHSKNDDNRPADEVAARWAARPARDPRPAAGRGRCARRSTPRSNRRWLTSSTGRGAVISARALGDALRTALENDDRVVLLGEDIPDPYGGAFKVTRGLSTRLPERVRSTPISEGAIAGVSAGLALAGFRPIAEIMFGDFLTLCFDQIVNHIAKYGAMYNGAGDVPGRHPHALRRRARLRPDAQPEPGEALPRRTAPARRRWLAVHDPDAVLRTLLAQDRPVLYIEHKLLYPLHLMLPTGGRIEAGHASEYLSPDGLPTVSIRPVAREDCSLTVLAYGYQAELARRVLERLAIEEEIFGELVVPARSRRWTGSRSTPPWP